MVGEFQGEGKPLRRPLGICIRKAEGPPTLCVRDTAFDSVESVFFFFSKVYFIVSLRRTV